MKKLLLLTAALALMATSCGGGEDDSATLPVNDGADSPAIDTTCLADEPECDDTPTGEPQDLPPPGDTDLQPVVALSVPDATAASGRVAVNGFLVVGFGDARLCEALAESFPPQCGGASVAVTSVDQIDPADLQSDGSVAWTDFAVTIVGEMATGTLIADPVE